MTLDKIKTIATEAELRAAIRPRLEADPVLRWSWKDLDVRHDDTRVDAVLELAADGRRRTFDVEFRLRPTARDIDALARRGRRHPWILIAPELSETLITLCRERGINALDLNGRTWIRSDGLIVDRALKSRDRYRAPLPSIDPFSLKSSRLIRTILSRPGQEWTLTSLTQSTCLSAGLVSRLLGRLEREGWIKKAGRQITLTRGTELVDAWAAVDDWAKRTSIRQYSALTKDLEDLAVRTRDGLSNRDNGPVFTQWFAANLRHAYTVAPVVSAYVHDFPAPSVETALGLRQVSDGGRLWLIVPQDEGVFQETRLVGGFALACDTQIYLDLHRAGLRGPEQAQELRKWTGFNRAS